MSFLEQPPDIITYEYLINLPVDELLSMCQVNTDINTLCQQDAVWRSRISKEFPNIAVKDIDNPRSWYLRQVLFGGEVYLHDTVTEKAEYETIVYQDLFESMKATAEKYKPKGREYVIIYSTFTDVYNIVAIQLQDWIIIQPGPSQKINLVDIVYVHLHDKLWRELDTFRYFITTYTNPRHINLRREYTTVKEFLLDKHKIANTNLYQRISIS